MSEEGSGTVLAAGLIGVLGFVLALTMSVTSIANATHEANAQADLAALAAAEVLHDPRYTDEPCAAAARVATIEITECQVDWPYVSISTRTEAHTILGLRQATGRAKAGPVM